jgi:hypothetical protein
MFLIVAFIPIQSAAIKGKNTTKATIINNDGTITRDVELTTFTNFENESSVYKYLAPIDLFAMTSSMFNLYDGNLTGSYLKTSNIEKAFYLPQHQVTTTIFQNKQSYEAIYKDLDNSKHIEFGAEIITANEQATIVENETFEISEYLVEKYKSNTIDRELNKSIEELAKISLVQYDLINVTNEYHNYLNDEGTHGNYELGGTGTSGIPKTTIMNGRYLDASEYISVTAAEDPTIPVDTLRQEVEHKETIANYFSLDVKEIKD